MCDLRMTGKFLCNQKSDAQNALKSGLVKRRCRSQKIQKQQDVQFSWGEKRLRLGPSKIFSAIASSDSNEAKKIAGPSGNPTEK